MSTISHKPFPYHRAGGCAWCYFLRSLRALWVDYAPTRALRFITRAAYWPLVTFRWCRFLSRMDFGQPDWVAAAGLLQKPYRPYINIQWTPRRRLSALITHYRTVGQLPRQDLLHRAHAEGCTLVTLRVVDGDYQLILAGCHDSREGELELLLQTMQGERIVTVLFAFVEPLPAPTVALGCLQGAAPAVRKHVVALSKAFHGVPVKLLVVKLARHLLPRLAPGTGIAHLVAVDDRVHVFQHWHYRRKHKVSASYSTTWSALGGQLRDDGFWEIPLTESPPDYLRLKSSKRSAAKHRWEALQDLYAAMELGLDGHGPASLTLAPR